MAIKFSESAGGAKKSEVTYYEFRDGVNKFRMIGGLLPRYVYWVPNGQGKNIPIECLGFDREKERFTNSEKDHVRDYLVSMYGDGKDVKETKCSWAYMVQVLDLADNKVKTMGLKKKMFEQIRDAAEHLGDPTSLEDGWTIVVKRKKTGPHAFNVEYTLDTLACKKEALTEEQLTAINGSKPIDELFPRQTPEDQKKFIDSLSENKKEDEADEEIANEFNSSVYEDDIPF